MGLPGQVRVVVVVVTFIVVSTRNVIEFWYSGEIYPEKRPLRKREWVGVRLWKRRRGRHCLRGFFTCSVDAHLFFFLSFFQCISSSLKFYIFKKSIFIRLSFLNIIRDSFFKSLFFHVIFYHKSKVLIFDFVVWEYKYTVPLSSCMVII